MTSNQLKKTEKVLLSSLLKIPAKLLIYLLMSCHLYTDLYFTLNKTNKTQNYRFSKLACSVEK